MPVFDFLRRMVKDCQDDDILGLAGEMAYWVIFSIFPFFIFLAAIAGIIGRSIGAQDLLDNVMDDLYSAVDLAAAESLRALLGQVLEPGSGALSLSAAIGALVALNTASGAIGTTIKACNRAYGLKETRGFIRQKGLALGFTLLLTISLIGGSLLLSLGGHLVRLLALGSFAAGAFTVLRVGGGLVGIVLGFALLYWKSPNLRQPFRWVFPGVAVATAGLIAFGYLFGLYVQLYAEETFNKTYGAIAGVVLFLFSLRLASIIVLIGAEINAEIARARGLLIPMARAQHVEATPVAKHERRSFGDRLSDLRRRRSVR